MVGNSTVAIASPPRSSDDEVIKRKLIFQGDDDLYFQSWYPICLSTEVAPGTVAGREFLGGRVAVFRTSEGIVQVVSAYCPHLGADLSIGTVVDDHIQCAFHKWEYDGAGYCVKIAAGDRPPAKARLFSFPTLERFGVVWAFNGTEPLWDLPDFEYPDEELIFGHFVTEEYKCDGWIFVSNNPDMQHTVVVHGVEFDGDPHDHVTWSEWGLRYPISARVPPQEGDSEPPLVEWRVDTKGVSISRLQGEVGSDWVALCTAFSCPAPGRHRSFGIVATRKADTGRSAERSAEMLKWGLDFGVRVAGEDRAILDTIRYRRGVMTRVDRTLGRFFEFMASYPRAHPSMDFIC